MTAPLSDRIEAFLAHPTHYSASETVELVEDQRDEAAVLRYALSLACSDGWADGEGAMRFYLETAATHLAVPGGAS